MKNNIFIGIILATLLMTGCTSTSSTDVLNDNDKSCDSYQKEAGQAFNFGANNFYKTYAVPNDYDGAVAQLFLIEEGLKGTPIGNFAKEYKKAETFYNRTLSVAKSKGCDVSKYPLSPVNAFRKGVSILKEKNNKKVN